MMTVDQLNAKLLELGSTQKGKDFVRRMIEDEVWYSGGDICPDCSAHERWVGENGIATGILVAHDDECPYFRGDTR